MSLFNFCPIILRYSVFDILLYVVDQCILVSGIFHTYEDSELIIRFKISCRFDGMNIPDDLLGNTHC